MKRLFHWLMQYGLMAAIVVWAMTVAMMAYRLDESPWRWAFVALAVGGVGTVFGILKLRKYIDAMSEAADRKSQAEALPGGRGSE
ncbi:MAG: hypothetical protein U0172_05270 [Nitrospiraceae bacterium]